MGYVHFFCCLQLSQLTIGAIDSQTTVDSLPGVPFLLHTEVAFGNTTMAMGGTYTPPPPPPPASCGTGGNCGLERQGPGCNDIACCSAVCAADPSCCASDWDTLCVNQAAVLCGIAPEHDNCAAPRPLAFGRFPFTTRNCNTDGGLLITECQDVQTAGAFTNDVWFVCTAFQGIAGQSYAVLSFASPTPFAQVADRATGLDDTRIENHRKGFIIELPAKQSCAADLDSNGEVGGSDLAQLMGAWGACGSCPMDIDGDDIVGGSDLAILLSGWGTCP